MDPAYTSASYKAPYVSEGIPFLQGSAKINDTIELPRLKEQKKIKSLQIFKKSQQQCHQVSSPPCGKCVTCRV